MLQNPCDGHKDAKSRSQPAPNSAEGDDARLHPSSQSHASSPLAESTTHPPAPTSNLALSTLKALAHLSGSIYRRLEALCKNKTPRNKRHLTQHSSLVSRQRNFVGGFTRIKNLLPPNGAHSSADLPAKQSDDSILNAVVMRFNDSVVALVIELEQLFVPNGTPKPLIQLLIDRHSILLYFTASYFLGLGGISETSTGSNSNLGSSASGAKYAFVVFRKFLSSRSGKSGL